MKFKKMMGILLTVAMAGTFVAGCGSKAPSTPDNNTNVEEGAGEETTEGGDVEAVNKIVIAQSKVEISDQLEELAAEYEAETGVEVEVWGTSGDDFVQQLKIKLSNDQGPTIFSLQPGAESEDLQNYLADLSDISFVNDIAEGMVDEIDGKVLGIPYTLEGFGVVYNKDLIDPTKVTNTDEFITMLKDQKAAGVNGFSLSQESYFLIGHILNVPFALQDNPLEYIDKLIAGEVTMQDTPEFQEFGKIMEAVRENTNNPLEVNYDKQTGDFATGKTASIHQGNWSYGMFGDYDIDFDMAIIPLPIADNDKISVIVPSAWYVNSQVSEGEIQAGKDFINWLYTSETGKRYITEEFGFIPVVKGIESANIDPLSQSVSDFTAEGKTIGSAASHWPAGIVDVYLVPVVTKFFTTEMTGEEFLTELSATFIEAGNK